MSRFYTFEISLYLCNSAHNQIFFITYCVINSVIIPYVFQPLKLFYLSLKPLMNEIPLIISLIILKNYSWNICLHVSDVEEFQAMLDEFLQTMKQ